MKKRIFIAINLPPEVKKRLTRVQEKWAHLPFRWTKADSLHITLAFIGYVTDDQLLEICQIAEGVAKKMKPFELVLERICYGPPDKPARMIWVEGALSGEMANLKDALEEVLFQTGGAHSPEGGHAFRPHITLGRLREGGRNDDLPPIEEKIESRFYVESIEIMESDLKSSGAEYVALQSAVLGD